MVVSEAGYALTKRFEGLRLQPYSDVAGYITVGWGHKLTAEEAQTIHAITEEDAERWLAEDLTLAGEAVTRLVKVPLQQHQFDALADFVFNLGAGALARSSALVHLNVGDYTNAASHLLLWDEAQVNGRLVQLPGLLARRKAEQNMFLGLI